MTKPLVRDGHIAVAVSPGYGAGWSTWNDVEPMDGRFNTLFDQGKYDEALELLEKLGLGYGGGLPDVELVWLPIGTKFTIREYDGYEWVQTDDEIKWYVAGEEE